MPFVSITRLRIRSWRYFVGFLIYALRSAFQAKKAEGNLAVSIVREAHKTFWTRTLWSSEEAMRSYMISGAHRKVMPRLLEWCDEAAVVHWTQESAEPPTWEEAHQKLQELGRPSKVNHPTEAHRQHRFPAPRLRRTSELRFK